MAYDNTPVEMSHGRGYVETNPVSLAGPICAGNPEYVFHADGTLTSYKITLRSANATDVSVAYLCIVSGTAGSYVIEQRLDIVAEVNAVKLAGAGMFSLVLTGLSIPVAADEFVAVYMDANCGFYVVELANSKKTMFTVNAVPPAPDAGDPSIALVTTGALSDFLSEGIYTTTSRLPFEDNNSDAGFGNGDLVHIPAYLGDDYHIVLRGVQVPDAESLIITAYKPSSAGRTLDVVQVITVDFTGTGEITDQDATAIAIAGEDGEKFDIHLYLEPVTHTDDVMFANLETGQGSVGDEDFQWKALNAGGVDILASTIATLPIRWVGLVNAGTNATVDEIVVCREPLVIVGDSFGGAYSISNSISILSRVGAALPAAFAEPRYGIPASISNGKVTMESTTSAAIRNRWNDADNDLCFFRGVVYCFVNGPGVNDITIIDASSSDTFINSKTYQVVGDIFKMVGDAVSTTINTGFTSDSCDVIMSEMIPRYPVDADERAAEQLCQKRINEALRFGAALMDVPMAMVFDGYAALEFGYNNDDGLHPTTAGAAWIALQMATVYEESWVPVRLLSAGPIAPPFLS